LRRRRFHASESDQQRQERRNADRQRKAQQLWADREHRERDNRLRRDDRLYEGPLLSVADRLLVGVARQTFTGVSDHSLR